MANNDFRPVQFIRTLPKIQAGSVGGSLEKIARFPPTSRPPRRGLPANSETPAQELIHVAGARCTLLWPF